jgi:hypothetical protein
MKELTLQTSKMLAVAAIALSTSGCVFSLFSAKFPSQVKVQAVYMDENPARPTPPPVSCMKAWMPDTIKLSRKTMARSPNTYVSWLIVNECEKYASDPDPTVDLGKWTLETTAGTKSVPPPFSSCEPGNLGTAGISTTIKYHSAATVTCKVKKDADKGKYRYAVIITIGSYADNKDSIIYIED